MNNYKSGVKYKSNIIVTPMNPDITFPKVTPMNPMVHEKVSKPNIIPLNPDISIKNHKLNDPLNNTYSYHLSHLMLEITTKCNLYCKHCYCNANSNSKNHLSLELLEKVLSEFKSNSGTSVTLTGGEPLLHPQIDKITDMLNYFEIPFSIFTNGTRINSKSISKLISKGLFSLQVSLDGLDNTHDLFRGLNGAFKKAIKALKVSIKSGIHVGMMVTIHEDNISEIPQLLQLSKILGINSVSMNSYMPQGRGKNLCEFELNELKNIYNNINLYSCSSSLYGTSCGVGFYKLAILSDGRIVPCEVLRDLTIGNIKNDNIVEVFNNSDIMRNLRGSVTNSIEECSTCIHEDECKGGCKAFSWIKTKSFYNPDYRQCHIRK